MSTNDADRLLTAWLASVAPNREPEHLLDAVLSQTARTARRPAWRFPERWIPVTTISFRATVGGRVPWPFLAALAFLVLALLAGAVLLAGARQVKVPPPFGPAANGSIAFESGGDVAVRDVATGRITIVAGDAGLDAGPAYSPDGTQLAWLHGVDPAAANPDVLELRVARPDGSGARSLGQFEGVDTYAWSPDGRSIAIEAGIAGEPAITMVDVATGRRTVLDVGMPARQPVFRPGGTQLVFRGRPDGQPWGLYLAGVDGSAPVHLALDPGFENDANYTINEDYYFLDPAWSPDGERLAFHTLEESTVPSDPDPGFRVHVADVDAAGTATNEAILPVDPSIDDEFQPAWLPDGTGIVVHRIEEGAHSLVRWPVSGSPTVAGTPQVLALPEDAASIQDLAFRVAPDGSEVAAWEPSNASWLVPVDGRPGTSANLAIDDGADWQRTLP